MDEGITADFAAWSLCRGEFNEENDPKALAFTCPSYHITAGNKLTG
jgi:hypothetical protein